MGLEIEMDADALWYVGPGRAEIRRESVDEPRLGELLVRTLYSAISRVAESSTPVLIRGESGTGKELVSRAIVSTSSRRDRPFISLNCAALPETLVEAELFGHEKGAFTGAHEARSGHFESAQGGTVFLDEIGSLGLVL